MTLRNTSRRAFEIALFAAFFCVSLPAFAAPSAADVKQADALFNKALDLMDGGKSAEACPLLEKSQELDPGMGTRYRIAECYEKTGRLEEARAVFVEVANASAAEGNLARDKQARDRAKAIEPKLAELTLDASAMRAPSETTLAIDEKPLEAAKWREPLWLAPGDHRLHVEAPGKAPWDETLALEAGEKRRVAIPALAPLAAPKAPAPGAPSSMSEDTSPPSRTLLYATLGAAGVATVVGTVFGIRTLGLKSAYEDSPSRSGLDEGRTSGLVTDVAFGAAVLLAGAGVALFLLEEEPGESERNTSVYIETRGAGITGGLSF